MREARCEPVDWDERLLEASLEEVLGGAQPRRLAHIRALPSPPRRRRSVALASAAAVVLVGLAFLWWGSRPSEVTPRFDLTLVVDRGQLDCSGSAATTLTAPSTVALALARGDRISAPIDTEFRVGHARPLRAVAGTQLEILDMKTKNSRGAVVVGAITLGVVAGTLSWQLMAAPGTATAGERVELDLSDPAEVAMLQSELDRLREENDELRQAARAGRGAERNALAVVEDPDDEFTPPEAPADPQAPSLVFSGSDVDDLLADVDWEVVGGAVADMVQLAERGITAVLAGGDLPMDQLAQLQMHNAMLIEQLAGVVEHNLERSGENGAFNHPVVAANTIEATLAAADQPLSSDQVAALTKVVEYYTALDDSQAATDYGSKMASILAQVETRRQFFGELGQLLGDEQRAALHPPTLEGYDMDMFDGDFMLRYFSRQVFVNTPADYAGEVSRVLGNDLRLEGAVAEQVQRVVADWSTRLPGSVFEQGTALEQLGTPRLLLGERTMETARQQVELIKQLMQSVPLTAQQRDALRRWERLLVPVPR